jgi:excalibur calcium-binding domain-containing protein
MKKILMPAIAVLITAGGVVLPVTASDAAGTASAVASFSNCTELNHVYHHGISNRHLTRHGWIRRGASGKGAYRPRLYKRVHSNLDRDGDHIACEN